MSNYQTLIDQLESLPYGIHKLDHVILDQISLETLKLCKDYLENVDSYDDLYTLISFLVRKLEEVEELNYA